MAGPRLAVVGLRRGLQLATWSRRLGFDVAAACDRDPERRGEATRQLPGVRLTARWEDLLALGLDGVVLANDFDAHAPLAIAFLDQGVNVLSETAACADAAEGRALVAAAARSRATYSFAENYVAHPHVRLLREVVAAGEIGRVQLIEADYLHGMAPDAVAALIKDPAHWRGRISPAAYCTHTVSPVMAITGAWPQEVSAFGVDGTDRRIAVVLAVRLSDGALALCRHGFLQGEPDSHSSWMSVRGTRGLAESVRAAGERAWSVRLRREPWATLDGRTVDEERVPPPVQSVDRHHEGTVTVLRAFRATIEHGDQPLVGVRPAVAASLVGVAGMQSLEEGSRPVPVPGAG